MNNLSLNWWIDEYMIFCRSRQLREKTLSSYEQSLRLFERWCGEALDIKIELHVGNDTTQPGSAAAALLNLR